MTVRVRIAPSPTGTLHIGTARTAIFNWLFASRYKGKFILRIEDTDEQRSKPEFVEDIKSGLAWLGLIWDEGPFFQTQRLSSYHKAIQQLLDQGLAYRCYCTSEELENMKEIQKSNNQAPKYDNRHRYLTAEQREAFEAEGRKAVIRFIINEEQEIRWNDLIRGHMIWKGTDLGGDMVIARVKESSDQLFGQPLYNLAVVVDDIDMNISHVIRGEDHIANTAKQILLYEALGKTIPYFAHTPLILNKEGRKLSKRDGVTSINDFQKMGFLSEALVNYMSLLGWTLSDSTQEIFSLEEIAESFDLERVNKAGAKFDWDKLDWVNSQYLHKMPVQQLLDLLIPYWKEANYPIDINLDLQWLERITILIQPSLVRLNDVIKESSFFFGENINYSNEALLHMEQDNAMDIIQLALAKIEKYPILNEDEIKEIISEIVKTLKVKKGLVMRSLRAGLSGKLNGPDLIESWSILNIKGWDKSRLKNLLSML